MIPILVRRTIGEIPVVAHQSISVRAHSRSHFIISLISSSLSAVVCDATWTSSGPMVMSFCPQEFFCGHCVVLRIVHRVTCSPIRKAPYKTCFLENLNHNAALSVNSWHPTLCQRTFMANVLYRTLLDTFMANVLYRTLLDTFMANVLYRTLLDTFMANVLYRTLLDTFMANVLYRTLLDTFMANVLYRTLLDTFMANVLYRTLLDTFMANVLYRTLLDTFMANVLYRTLLDTFMANVLYRTLLDTFMANVLYRTLLDTFMANVLYRTLLDTFMANVLYPNTLTACLAVGHYIALTVVQTAFGGWAFDSLSSHSMSKKAPFFRCFETCKSQNGRSHSLQWWPTSSWTSLSMQKSLRYFNCGTYSVWTRERPCRLIAVVHQLQELVSRCRHCQHSRKRRC